jgi:hypothetical protein
MIALALSSVLSVARGPLSSIFFIHFTLHATPKISFPHSPNDKERDNKNNYANSDGGEPIAVNPISCARTHAQSDNERDAQVHRHAWRSCGRPGCDVKGGRRSYDGNFHTTCAGVLRHASEAKFGPAPSNTCFAM